MVIAGLLIFSAFIYCILGHLLGRMSNSLYNDDTPTEELLWYKKIVRILFSPVSYHTWHTRAWYSDWNNAPSLRGLAALDHPNASQEDKNEAYILLTTFFWPLKLINAVIGIMTLFMFMIPVIVCFQAKCIAYAYHFITRILYTLSGSIKYRALCASGNEIQKLIHFQEKEIGAHLDRLRDEKTKATRLQTSLQTEIEAWRVRTNKLDNRGFNIKRYAKLLKKLEDKAETVTAKVNTIDAAMRVVNEKKEELDILLEVLHQYETTIPLLDDDSCDDIERETLKTAFAAMNACRQAVEKAGAIERNMMDKVGTDLDELVEQREDMDALVTRSQEEAGPIEMGHGHVILQHPSKKYLNKNSQPAQPPVPPPARLQRQGVQPPTPPQWTQPPVPPPARPRPLKQR